MKNLIILTLVILFTSCQNNQYNIEGNIPEINNGVVILETEDVLGNKSILNTGNINNGKFSVKGATKEIPESAILVIMQKNEIIGYELPIVLEKGNIRVRTLGNKYIAEGTPQNNLISSLEMSLLKNDSIITQISSEYKSDISTEDSLLTTAKIDSVINLRNNEIKNFIANHNDKVAGITVISQNLDIMNEEEVYTLILTAGPDFVASPLYNKVKKRYNELKNKN